MNGKYPNAPLCHVCGTQMCLQQKPLFTGWFCPLECDKKLPGPKIDDEWDTPTQPYGSKSDSGPKAPGAAELVAKARAETITAMCPWRPVVVWHEGEITYWWDWSTDKWRST